MQSMAFSSASVQANSAISAKQDLLKAKSIDIP